MPFIEELDQQKAALVRINRNLSEVTKVNTFVSRLETLQSECEAAKTGIEITFNINGSFERLKCPILIDDYRYILNAVENYKRSVVEKITRDSELYRISLTPEDKTVIEMKLNVSES